MLTGKLAQPPGAQALPLSGPIVRWSGRYRTPRVCNDGVDNDGDTYADFALDSDCLDIDGTSEGGGPPPAVPVLPGPWPALLGAALLGALVLRGAFRAR